MESIGYFIFTQNLDFYAKKFCIFKGDSGYI